MSLTTMSTGEWVNTGIMDPGERIKRFGIECVGPQGDGILFAAGQWKPGGEYVQKLIVRNVTTTVKKVKYKLPSTRYFSLAYPEVIVLSPGMFTELDVVFRPVVYDPYDDFILFRMQDGPGSGEFRVPVRALISKLQVSAPFGIDLGFSSTHQTTSRVFQLDNFGEVDAPFRWDVPYPFKLEPSEGIIPVGETQDIEVSIVPTDASVFVSEAICHVGEGVHAIIPEPILVTKLSAIGKYSYIVLSESNVEFGEVLSGTPSETFSKEIILRNQGVVPAEFECIRHDNDRDEVFNIYPRSGVVPTQGEITVTISYSPLASGCFSLDRYTFKTPGDCRTVLTCSGTSMMPKVTLYKDIPGRLPNQDFPEGAPANSINFRDVCVGGLETRLFFLKNHSNVKVNFSILIDDEGIFKMTPRQGVIPAQMEAPVKISFSPTSPINYYRRVFILIGDALPLFVDIMGTAFIRAKGEVKEQRPAPLRHAHIQAYRNRCTAGVGDLNPDEMDAILEREGMSEWFAQVGTQGTRAVSVANLRNPLTRTGEASRIDVAASHELFINDTEPHCRGIVLDNTDLDFGFTLYQTSSQSKTVTLTNTTKGKVAVAWFPPRVHGDYDTDATSAALGLDLNSPVFSVEPAHSEIPPGGSQKYRVTFHPLQSNRGFISEIEVVAFFKNQRTFRLVNDATLTPPWTSVLRATGHTFATGQLLAKVGLKSGAVRNGKLVFPACYLGDSVFQTVRLTNTSNLPAIFRIEMGFEDSAGMVGSELDGVFTVKPEAGEIAAEDFAMVCIKFTPNNRKKVVQLIRCIVNGSLGGQLMVEGVGSLPQICCPDVIPTPPKIGQLLPAKPYTQEFFCLNPTSVGLSSSREFSFRNCSRLPLRFFCNLPPAVRGIIDVSPSYGFLRGNGDTKITISFAPQAIETTQCKLEVEVFPIGGRPSKVIDARQPGTVATVQALQKFKVNLVAQGGVGAVVFDPPEVDADVKLVNTQETKHIVLENVCDSVLEYELYYRMEFTPEPGSESTEKVYTPVQRMKNTAASSNGSAEHHQSLFCESPEGFLPARSRRSVLFTFQPNRAGLFQFVVCVRLKSVDAKGNGLTISNEESALLHSAEMRMMKQMEDAEGLDDISGLPLTMCVTGRASFPTLKIEDIRTDTDTLISDVRNLWDQFSVPQINHEMNAPLTDEEVHFNTISSPDLNTLRRYPFRFTPDVIGSPQQMVYLQLRNSGFLTTSFKLSLPNEKELDLEHWCDEDELTEERLTFISILEELKCFEIEPREGVLAPGEGVVISMRYSHSSLKYLGYHRLPVHLKLSQGKQFWIDLIGITLDNNITNAKVPSSAPSSAVATLRNQVAEKKPPTVMLFASTDGNGQFHFKSVPVGVPTGELPMQRMEVINVGGLDISYDVDQSSIRLLAKNNFDHDVLQVLNPKGVIAARSSHYIEWIFHPLEATTYTVDLSIRYQIHSQDIAPAHSTSRRRKSKDDSIPHRHTGFLNLVLHGQGYDIRLERPPPPGSLRIGALPPSKRLVEIDSLAALSEDCINFGVVPKCLTASRLVVLRNTSSNAVEFSVDESSCYMMSIDTLTITPDKGKIEPYEMVVLEVSISAMCQPLIINDRVKIVVQSVIKPVVKRGGGSRHDKIKEKLRSRGRIGTATHSEVVQTPTLARSRYMESAEFRDGSRTASYPTSMSKTASAVLSPNNSKASFNGNASASNLDNFSFGGGGIGTPGTMSRAMSATSYGSRTGSGFMEDAKSLRGPAEVLTLRLEGEIYSADVISNLFDLGPQKGIMDTFVSPTVIPFVPPRSASTIPNATLRVVTPGAETELSRSSSRNGIRPVPASERQSEVRGAVDCILSSIFRDVLNSKETHDQLTRAITRPVSGLSFSETDDNLVPTGGPVYGVFFQEVVTSLGLSFRLVDELKECRCPISGQGHSNLQILKTDLRKTLLQKFKFSRKNQAFKEIESIMESIRGDFILLRDFVPSLSDNAVSVLEKKLDSLVMERQKFSKMRRQGTLLVDGVGSRSGGQGEEEDTFGEGAENSTYFSNLSENSQSSSKKESRYSLNVRQQTALMLDSPAVDDIECITSAAQTIQNIARGTRDRALAQRKKEDLLNSKLNAALTQGEFVTIAGDILRNTMYNLMQEAVFDEFQVLAEPIKFVVKKEEFDESVEEGDSAVDSSIW